MIASNMKYDNVISFGINCATSAQIQMRKLRLDSGPIDWVYCAATERLFDQLKHWFENDFEDILGNPLELLEAGADFFGNLCFHDATAGYIFSHEFDSPQIPDALLKEVQARYRRRGKRLCEKLRAGGKHLFVLTRGKSHFSEEEVVTFFAWLRERFPTATIDALLVYHSAPEKKNVELAPGIYCSYQKKRFRFARELRFKSKTYGFLDRVRLTLMDDPQAWQAAKARERSEMLARNRTLAMRLPVWKQFDRKGLGELRTLLRNNYKRGVARFPHLPLWDRLMFWCFTFLRWKMAIRLIPLRPGLSCPAKE